jgi:RND family efflux transporter MFP subunit
MSTRRSLIRQRLELAAVLAAILAVGCRGERSVQPAATAPAGPPTVETTDVVQQPVDVLVQMPAELRPYEEVAMYPKVTGFVKTVRVDRGSRVRRGELLAELEAPELVAQRAEGQSKVQAADAQLAVARAKADSDQSTYDKLKAASAMPGVVAGNDLVIAQKAVEGAEHQVSAAQENAAAARQALQSITEMQGYLTLSAPFDGIVTERNVHPGALVGPTGGPGAAQPMLRIVQDSRLRLVVAVPQAYVAAVMPGSVVSFTVPAYPGKSFSGKVARIAHDVDVRTRTMPVELDVMNPKGELASGTFCQVQWPLHRPSLSLFVPARSVASTTDRTFVVRVSNGSVEWVDVQTGLSSGSLVEVFGDLHPGDRVAARGTDQIRPGTAVQARDAKSAS